MILGLELQREKVKLLYQNIGIHPKIRTEGNSAEVCVKIASSETVIVKLVYYTCLYCGGSMKCLFPISLVISRPGRLAVNTFM